MPVREAVRRINANKDGYLHHFIDYHKAKNSEIATLKISDWRVNRLQVTDPRPISEEEL